MSRAGPSNLPRDFEGPSALVGALFSLLHNDSALEVRAAAADVLLQLLETADELRFEPDRYLDTHAAVVAQSPLLIVSLAAQALDAQTNIGAQRHALETMRLVDERLCTCWHEGHSAMPAPKQWTAALAIKEIATLIGLCSLNADVRAAALAIVHIVVRMFDDPKYASTEYGLLMPNTFFYAVVTAPEALRELPAPNSSRAVQRKWLQGVWRVMEAPTPALVATWEEALRRWRALLVRQPIAVSRFDLAETTHRLRLERRPESMRSALPTRTLITSERTQYQLEAKLSRCAT
jgi:hypothetical protein